MAVGVPLPGTSARLTASATLAGTYDKISHVTSYSRDATSSIQELKFLEDATIATPDPAAWTATLEAAASYGDTGQIKLLDAKLNGTTVFIKDLYDATKGSTQEYRVGTITSRRTPDGIQLRTFQLVGVGAPAAVASGEIAG